MPHDSVTWGASDQKANQGWAHRSDFDRRFWSTHWSAFWNTHERDGAVNYDPSRHGWFSQNDLYISFPRAVINDFGDLVAVP